MRPEKHNGVSKISAQVKLSPGIHQFLLTHVGYEKRHGAIKILALGMQVRPLDGLWAIMRGRLRTQENRPNVGCAQQGHTNCLAFWVSELH